ncbi:MAG: hypothetical protein IPO95_00400 [Rhodanobacteraceae bacterium]|nr:hypothetical protein [Rhodanobacteraceae bacterium]MBL0041100.1 hypothetical protein [Xanthomonadales bacterium]HQW81520.1 hypothetical protein [Pseudomonadota bacterium]
MSSTFSARIDYGLTGEHPVCELSGIAANLVGHDAVLSLRLRVDVKRSSGVDANKQVFEQAVKVTATQLRVPIASTLIQGYRYKGHKIDIEMVAKLRVDDGVIFDTTLEAPVDAPLLTPQGDAAQAAKWVEPPDQYSLAANLRALSPKDRFIAKVLLGIAGVLGGGNAAIGMHDQVVPESSAIWYDQHGSDGSESPAMKSLAGSGVLGAGLWLVLRARLRRYMRISLTAAVSTPRRGERIAARMLVEGEARVPLERSTLRVVAANRENGQYTERSGKETKTRKFQEPVQAVVLFEQFLPLIPAGAPLSDHLDGDVDFDPIFTDLMPPLMAGENHGIDLVWEVQLLHPDFVDQELQGPNAWITTDWPQPSESQT